MSNFRADLKFGNQYEDIFIKHWLGNPLDIFRPSGKFKSFDFSSQGIFYEVKADRKCHSTGNLCIEFECNGVPSGISSTLADTYVIFVINPDTGYTLYLIPVWEIKQMINKKQYHRTMKGGDGWRSAFHLFSKDLFSKYIIDDSCRTVPVENRDGILQGNSFISNVSE